jgi:hypothetical protein
MTSETKLLSCIHFIVKSGSSNERFVLANFTHSCWHLELRSIQITKLLADRKLFNAKILQRKLIRREIFWQNIMLCVPVLTYSYWTRSCFQTVILNSCDISQVIITRRKTCTKIMLCSYKTRFYKHLPTCYGIYFVRT